MLIRERIAVVHFAMALSRIKYSAWSVRTVSDALYPLKHAHCAYHAHAASRAFPL